MRRWYDMSFDDMPDRGLLTEPGAQDFVDRALARSRKVVATSRTLLDVPYGKDYYQKIDIFLPADKGLNAVPVLLFIHGGGWQHGFKEWMGFIAPAFLDLPAIFVAVNHRLAPEHKHPAQLEDCIDALAWVHRNIEAHGGDPERLFIGGHSSGGHLAALVTLRPDLVGDRDLPADIIKGCFPVSGAFNLHLSNIQQGTRRDTLVRDLLANERDDRDASPVNFVDGNKTPIFLAFGSEDVPGIIADNKQMIERHKPQPGICERHELAGLSHFQTNEACGDTAGVWVRKVRKRMVSTPSTRMTAAQPLAH